MAINWISVNTRVPDTRRWVLVWVAGLFGRRKGPTVSRFNPSRDGGRFDHEGGMLPQKVTHWAEVNEPKQEAA